jgi:acyl-CoA thioester hydrolase
MSKYPSITYRVAYADTDQMAMVYHANYLVLFERARNNLLRDVDYSYAQMEADGFLLPVLEAHVNYHQPARFDDLLTVTVDAEMISTLRIRMTCEVLRDGEKLADGYTIHTCLSTESGKPVRFPKKLQDAVNAYQRKDTP